MEEIMNLVVQLMVAVLTALLGLLFNKLREWLKENANSKAIQTALETMRAYRAIVQIAVEAVEQTATELEAEEKFQSAKKMAIDMINEEGLPLKEAQVDGLIEQVVREMNKLKDDFISL